AGALVTAESGGRCALPCELQLPTGKVSLSVDAEGYARRHKELYVSEGENESLEFELKPLTGKLVVNTDERGAAVQIDGKLAGFTPAVMEVPVGVRRVRITLPGFSPVERPVNVEHGEQPPLEVQLSAIEEVNAASR